MNSIRILLFVSLIGILSCNRNGESGPYVSISGFTQGTSYHITYQSPGNDTLYVQDEINALLADFDQSLSTYIDTSNISRLNNNETSEVDHYFIEVYNEAKRIYDISGGAFDITVGPLIDAWGFGPGRKLNVSEEVIDSILQFVGMAKIGISGGRLMKELPGIRLDLNAIAQGYAVDVVADYLDEKEVSNYMVEIGGEITTKGVSPRNDDWKIGIDKPYFGNQMPGQNLQEIVRLSGKSLASSGNYRKYYEQDGKKIVHTVDPRSGYTKMSNLLSVTIITDKCITADGLATACMSLGLEDARSFIEGQEDVEALFIYSDQDGNYLEWMTSGMKGMLLK
ncbi:MAG: FAD:protein FMN transferase [Bacteroidales bacterium]|nr:FAD:protein FMN transferase [Bacteroidales bacterium]